jgi:xylulose-5-phosphate/fructose-6-phosphate phosphoketolase
MEAMKDEEQKNAVEAWLRSYRFDELFDGEKFHDDILSLVPPKHLRMGSTKHACVVGNSFVPLTIPEMHLDHIDARGKQLASAMKKVGTYLKDVFAANEATQNFALMSPDETYSNKLDAVFGATHRSFNWPMKPWDKDLGPNGRVYEMLSEHTLAALLQGYILTGRYAVMASYEAFMQVVTSMVDQYAKYLRICRETSWRSEIPSANYILTSSSWRQDHNGFSHQNPGFISDMLERHGNFVNVYFPADANSAVAVMKTCLESKSQINVIVGGKTDDPVWLTPEEAEAEVKAGISIWGFASDENPDIVLAASGNYMVKESLAAIDLAKQEHPELRTRFVDVLTVKAVGLTCSNNTCVDIFTADKPVIYNFHGYPDAIKAVLFDNAQLNPLRFSVHGYCESGSTTSPFDMQVRNKTDRYNLVIDMFRQLAAWGTVTQEKAQEVIAKYEEKLRAHRSYIIEHGVDPAEIDAWTWTRS